MHMNRYNATLSRNLTQQLLLYDYAVSQQTTTHNNHVRAISTILFWDHPPSRRAQPICYMRSWHVKTRYSSTSCKARGASANHRRLTGFEIWVYLTWDKAKRMYDGRLAYRRKKHRYFFLSYRQQKQRWTNVVPEVSKHIIMSFDCTVTWVLLWLTVG